jgi:hypothetical protein
MGRTLADTICGILTSSVPSARDLVLPITFTQRLGDATTDREAPPTPPSPRRISYGSPTANFRAEHQRRAGGPPIYYFAGPSWNNPNWGGETGVNTVYNDKYGPSGVITRMKFLDSLPR